MKTDQKLQAITFKQDGFTLLIEASRKHYKILGVIDRGKLFTSNELDEDIGTRYTKKELRSAYTLEVREATEEDIGKALMNAL